MPAIEVDYAIEGTGPALYMVHGIGSRKVTWQGLIPHLRAHFTCVSFDLRGHGSSPLQDLSSEPRLRGPAPHRRNRPR